MELIQTESLTGMAAARLRHAILGGELRPGEPVRVRELQARLGISHIPIREAIRQLEAEGLIIAPPRRTPVVAGVDLDELAAIYELRRLIELPIVRLARERATDVHDQRVREAFAAFESLATESQSAEYWQRHTAFHWSLLEAAGNRWTRRTLDPLWAGAERYVRLFVSEFATPEYTMRLHRELLDAWATRDPEQIVAALEGHFVETQRVVHDGYQKQRHAGLLEAS
jgi:DNA-binding GntR family transcriptional regulator